ncbi:uncharacterized protein K460DRAFT_400997 [Cucurbitaria berberidis CBS 394.84]|uniref:Uncharacterized protein n=1 Tax=Cucurbitaria berberidis CBS 394.84 TaxID=1168544 RepID=A0A9P4GTC9_9PLEO|nr:uncharacterized protein K460DRAFT_400997 [Cucurbitaria berberidis CBS 394.84]KAF1850962.1 hypothetical protein K460DRAFT_400997 [Cucurbitaria berberidis CBS 394.84]
MSTDSDVQTQAAITANRLASIAVGFSIATFIMAYLQLFLVCEESRYCILRSAFNPNAFYRLLGHHHFIWRYFMIDHELPGRRLFKLSTSQIRLLWWKLTSITTPSPLRSTYLSSESDCSISQNWQPVYHPWDLHGALIKHCTFYHDMVLEEASIEYERLAIMLKLRALFFLAFLMIGPHSTSVYETRGSQAQVPII